MEPMPRNLNRPTKRQAIIAAYRRNPDTPPKVIAMEAGVNQAYASAVIDLEKWARYAVIFGKQGHVFKKPGRA